MVQPSQDFEALRQFYEYYPSASIVSKIGPDWYFVVKQDEGRIVSAAYLGMFERGAGIFGVLTAPDCRGRGYAREVLQDILDHIHLQRFWLRVDPSNPAKHLYESLGFKWLGEIENGEHVMYWDRV